ncbi:Na(+)-translocating NADH-quinone reductase subunit F [Leptobacterium flavescens]|uniref:Na(+)-translocating NADH-quinone reductase subunit F n=1 Tax=Leptobacterium flavescens TaxID=472055 RepID=A0A6P0UJA2_9FLAO|nr:Na(+)-translocating NADH-quinone reductase subunit F [Leptobacterium flavescens]NER13451.1 Na(+)-translocating NADH-quinone reductase subunit F [Leptobacterium flavescens]
MKISQRLENAISKLYTAFHTNTLHPECRMSCAVGNICDNTTTWTHLTNGHGSLQLSYIGQLNEAFGRKVFGYSPSELLQIEAVFLTACGYEIPLAFNAKKPKDPADKELLFNALCAVVEFLCKLDGVPNVMDYSKLFEFEDDRPKYELPAFA